MAEIDLPYEQAASLELVRGPLADLLGGERRMCLGGGVALAARWAHRCSLDIWLFADPSAYAGAFLNRRRFHRDVRLREVAAVGVGPDATRIVLFGGGEVTLCTGPPVTARAKSEDVVRGTGLRLASSAEILARKVGYPIAARGEVVPSDIYDFVAARRHDAVALREALRALIPSELDEIGSAIRHLPADWMRSHPQRLIDPDDAEDAVHAVAIARRLIDRERRARGPSPSDLTPRES